jgi:tRNA modification GTPase
MRNNINNWNDTIVALATPNGIGALAIIRVSGLDCFKLVNQLFPYKILEQLLSHTIHHGFLTFNNSILDEVVLNIFKSPKSFTGENVIEINCHGSAYIQQTIIEALIAVGCRLAKPGEFTQRAFLNGKLDLTQAEAVIDVISSNTEASKKAAITNLKGGFKHVLSNLREELLKFSSLIQLELDFAEEDVEFINRQSFLLLLDKLISQTFSLYNSFKLGNVIKNGVQVAIVGKPNAGKSTLLNTLLNENRAIVSEIPGTTRDTIEEVINIEGVIFRLIDTAGIRSDATDIIEGLGIERSREKIQIADLVLFLFDVNEYSENDLLTIINEFKDQNKKYIIVANKIDDSSKDVSNKFPSIPNIIYISAKDKLNIHQLTSRLVEMSVEGDINTESLVITNARHYEALSKLLDALNEIKSGLQSNLTGDLLSIDIKSALHYLGVITGEITTEDQLDYIFSKFCIGK